MKNWTPAETQVINTCFNLLLNRTTEEKLLRAAGDRIDIVKEAITWYNRHKESGWVPPGFITVHVPDNFYAIKFS